jgi:hypothetical protein
MIYNLIVENKSTGIHGVIHSEVAHPPSLKTALEGGGGGFHTMYVLLSLFAPLSSFSLSP